MHFLHVLLFQGPEQCGIGLNLEVQRPVQKEWGWRGYLQPLVLWLSGACTLSSLGSLACQHNS